MDIDQDAPVQVRKTKNVIAPPEIVWDLLADVDGWRLWDDRIEDADITGPLRPGTVLRWRSAEGTVTAVLREVDRPHGLAWTGTARGIHAVHAWRLEPLAGGTLVTDEESWSGLAVRLARRRMAETLERAVADRLVRAKAEAERRAAVPHAA